MTTSINIQDSRIDLQTCPSIQTLTYDQIRNMDFPRLTLRTTRGYRYSYILIPPSSATSYILFLHGFPSLALDWHHQISHFSSLGYGILAPDLLGYGGTDRPSDPDSYRHKLIVADLVEILDHHNIKSPINAVAHDFGVPILTRLEFYHPNRILSMAFLTVGCSGLCQTFDLKAVNSMTKQMLGYEGYGYIQFLSQDPEAARLLATHHVSFTSLMFTSDHGLWKYNFGALGGLRRWLEQDEIAPTLPSITTGLDEAHRNSFSRADGYIGPINWYKVQARNLNQHNDKARLDELGVKEYKLSNAKPLLLLLAGRDYIALSDVQRQMSQGYSKNLAAQTLDTGHWTMLELPSEVNKLLETHFNKV